MKNLYLLFIGLICGSITSAYATTYNITNVNTAFSPDSISAHVGDTVKFTLGSAHNVLEVTQSTWDANGNTSNGGISLGFGGGTVVLTTASTIYYVCVPHAHLGMKGRIYVLPATPVAEVQNSPDIQLRAYPNPVGDLLSINFYAPANEVVNIDLLDISGRTVEHLFTGKYSGGNNIETVNMQDLNPGLYFVKYNSKGSNAIVRVLKPE